MSTDNTRPSATQSGSGRLFLGIAIGCGCSLIMALGLLAVLFVVLNLWCMTPIPTPPQIRHSSIPVPVEIREINPCGEILKPAGPLFKPVVPNDESPSREQEPLHEQKQQPK